MRLLVMDTTGFACSAALRVPGRTDLCVSEDMARGQAERLAPMVQEILAEAGLKPGDLDRIGVTTGPGSFAGTRVGVAFARGLSLAADADCVGISNLHWWAQSIAPGPDVPIIVHHDAKRGEIVSQVFNRTSSRSAAATRTIAEAKALDEKARNSVGDSNAAVLVGTGAHLVDGGPVRPPPGLNVLLDIAENAKPPFDRPKPFYARPPDAKLPGGRSPE
ncbi:tRNA (adenosine(37)-N6)-threonylcarbamoyltransferase complex dimerization subunit type 1 TsaB [Hyphobacterium sp.]|uniref:tRNA (adenosine(37)-N6)-threonylcarbamoyltransferase complex dimerization subunit type 1 TsaB n=1 Tax=Hyphobacterium sp. TaxID=2004662 RepID=UPI003BAA66EB